MSQEVAPKSVKGSNDFIFIRGLTFEVLDEEANMILTVRRQNNQFVVIDRKMIMSSNETESPSNEGEIPSSERESLITIINDPMPTEHVFDVIINTDRQRFSINASKFIDKIPYLPDLKFYVDPSMITTLSIITRNSTHTVYLKEHNPVIQDRQIIKVGEEYKTQLFNVDGNEEELFKDDFRGDELLVRNFFGNELKDMKNSREILKEIDTLAYFTIPLTGTTFHVGYNADEIKQLIGKKCGRHMNAVRALAVILAAQNNCSEAIEFLHMARHLFYHLSLSCTAYTSCFIYTLFLSVGCRNLCNFVDIKEKGFNWRDIRKLSSSLEPTGITFREDFFSAAEAQLDKGTDFRLNLTIPMLSHRVSNATLLSYVYHDQAEPLPYPLRKPFSRFSPDEYPMMLDNLSASLTLAFLKPSKPLTILKLLLLPSIINRQEANPSHH